MVWTKYSISIVFLDMVFDESDGSVEKNSFFPVRLSNADL